MIQFLCAAQILACKPSDIKLCLHGHMYGMILSQVVDEMFSVSNTGFCNWLIKLYSSKLRGLI
jgi:hypothetical protein